MPEKKTIEEFEVQEMIKTFKSISNRLQKDFLIVTLILLYILIIKIIPIPGFGKGLDYNEFATKIIILIVFFILNIIISALLFKVNILYRKIDDTIKRFYYYSPNMPVPTKVHGAQFMTPFIISDNFISDFIVSGHKRHPSIRRIIFLSIFPTIFFSISSSYVINDLTDNIYIWYSLLLPSILFYGFFYYLLTNFFFVKRSAFLNRSEIGSRIIVKFSQLIGTNVSSISPFLIAGIEPQLELFFSEFNALKLYSIFDSNEYIILIKRIITEMKKNLSKISADEPKNQTEKQKIKEFDRIINNISDDIIRFSNTTDYSLAIEYHSNKALSVRINNFFAFIYYSLKK